MSTCQPHGDVAKPLPLPSSLAVCLSVCRVIEAMLYSAVRGGSIARAMKLRSPIDVRLQFIYKGQVYSADHSVATRLKPL